ncbi:MAG: hypothetical protein K6G50_06580 [bacterium]|nr:hypothetical protein [bacterium]
MNIKQLTAAAVLSISLMLAPTLAKAEGEAQPEAQGAAVTERSAGAAETNEAAAPNATENSQDASVSSNAAESSQDASAKPDNANSAASEAKDSANSADGSQASTEADKAGGDQEATSAPSAADGDAPDVLAPLRQDINQKGGKIELESQKPHFSVLNSSNPQDYKRTEGIWISDSGNGRIVYMKNIEGQDFYTIGISGQGIGRFLHPEQIWVDIEGKIYVADRGNNRIIRMDDIRGFGWTEWNGFSSPRGIAAHGQRIYISDTGNNRILVYDSFKSETPMATLDDPKIKEPGYLWLDMEGDLYVCCGIFPENGKIVKIPYNLTTPPNEWEVYSGRGLKGQGFTPAQIAVTDEGIYCIDPSSQRLLRMDDMKGHDLWELGEYGTEQFEFIDPLGLSQDENGSIFIADTGNDRIVKIDNIRGKGWTTYHTYEPNFSLRSPKSVYVWSPRPPLPDPEEEEDKDKDKGKGKVKAQKK